MFDLLKSLLEAGKEPDGTYVGVKLSKESKKKLAELQKSLNVPNPLNSDDMHVTVIYSRKYLPEFKSKGKLEKPIKAKLEKLEIFPARNEKNCLVVKLKSPELTKRHKEIMKEHGATYDWDEYKPHVTLSYDVGDFDPKKHDLKDHLNEIEIVEEYDQDLKLDWLVNKDKDG
jgi:hypothetical protein